MWVASRRRRRRGSRGRAACSTRAASRPGAADAGSRSSGGARSRPTGPRRSRTPRAARACAGRSRAPSARATSAGVAQRHSMTADARSASRREWSSAALATGTPVRSSTRLPRCRERRKSARECRRLYRRATAAARTRTRPAPGPSPGAGAGAAATVVVPAKMECEPWKTTTASARWWLAASPAQPPKRTVGGLLVPVLDAPDERARLDLDRRAVRARGSSTPRACSRRRRARAALQALEAPLPPGRRRRRRCSPRPGSRCRGRTRRSGCCRRCRTSASRPRMVPFTATARSRFAVRALHRAGDVAGREERVRDRRRRRDCCRRSRRSRCPA